jgi:oligoribonuclease
MQRNDLLVWIDLEMTGLNPERDSITEIAIVLTDSDLNVITEGPDMIIHYGNADHLNELVASRDFPLERAFADAILASPISTQDAQQRALEFLREHIIPQSSPLCGNSIHMDRYFLTKQMPKVVEYLHYRNLDVSTIKELARRWRPDLVMEVENRKKKKHRAKDDILESIEELRFYRKNFFN